MIYKYFVLIYNCHFKLKRNMRPLTDEELRFVFEKLECYLGANMAKLIDRQVSKLFLYKTPFYFLYLSD